MTLDRAIIVTDHAHVDGGQARVALDTARGLAERGWRVEVIAGRGPIGAELAHPRIATHLLGRPDMRGDPRRLHAATTHLWSRGTARRLAELLATHDPARSVVHLHGWLRTLSPAILPALGQSGLPVLVSLHDHALACPTGRFYDARQQRICTRAPQGAACLAAACDGGGRAHKLWRHARFALQRGCWPARLTDFALPGARQAARMRPHLPRAARLHVLPNPVAAPAGPRVRAETHREVLFVGRLVPEKGGVLLARAAAAAGLPLTVVGAGPEAGAIRAAHPGARLTGWQEADGVAAALARARVLALPSLWEEVFGLTAAAALARGVPVLAGDWTGTADLIPPGGGWTVAGRDVAAWQAALARIGHDDAGVAAASRAAHAAATMPARYFERLTALYARVAA